jgi:membrane protein YdbS with pleckstrin-like domain
MDSLMQPPRNDQQTQQAVVGSFEPLAHNARGAMRFGALLGCVFLMIPLSFFCTIAVDKLDAGLLTGLAIFGVPTLLLFALGWWYGGERWRRSGVALDERGIAIRRGVWFQTETFVPRSRIQHTDINRGPIDRLLGLASLKLYTAGTRLASVQVEGLGHERATELRDALVSHDDDAI